MANPILEMDEVERIRGVLQQAPEVLRKQVSRANAIRLLIPEIVAMRGRGYSVPQIASMLTDQGLPVSVLTLKGHLREAEHAERARPKKKARKGAGRQAAVGRAAAAKEAESSARATQAKGAAAGPPSAATAPAVAAASGAAMTGGRKKEGVNSAPPAAPASPPPRREVRGGEGAVEQAAVAATPSWGFRPREDSSDL